MQGIPLAAGAQHEENGIHGVAILYTGSVAPQWVRLPWGEQRLDTFPQLVGDAPSTADFCMVVTHHARFCGKVFLPTGYHKNSLLG
jgi:hypothetical protein